MMGRPRTGHAQWDDKRGWRARVIKNGKRSWVSMRHIGKDDVAAAKACAADIMKRSDQSGSIHPGSPAWLALAGAMQTFQINARKLGMNDEDIFDAAMAILIRDLRPVTGE